MEFALLPHSPIKIDSNAFSLPGRAVECQLLSGSFAQRSSTTHNRLLSSVLQRAGGCASLLLWLSCASDLSSQGLCLYHDCMHARWCEVRGRSIRMRLGFWVCVFFCVFVSVRVLFPTAAPPRSCPTQSTEQRQTCCLALDLHFLCEESSQGREESAHVNLHVAYFQHIIPTMAAAPESPIREAAPQSHHLFHALSAPLDEHYVLDGAHFAKPHAHTHSQAHTHAMLPPPLLPSSYVHGMPMYAPPPPHNPSPAAAPAPAQHYGHHTSHAAVSNPLSSGAYHSPPPSPAHPSATPSSSKRRRRRASSESDEDSDGAWSDGQQGDEELMPKWSVSMLVVCLFWFVRCPRSRLFPL